MATSRAPVGAEEKIYCICNSLIVNSIEYNMGIDLKPGTQIEFFSNFYLSASYNVC